MLDSARSRADAQNMTRHVWRDRVRQEFVAYALVYSALLLTPIFGLLVAVMARVEDSRDPDLCSHIFCDEPGVLGLVMGAVYLVFFLLVFVVVALLGLVGGPRLTIARNCLAIACVAFAWGWVAVSLAVLPFR